MPPRLTCTLTALCAAFAASFPLRADVFTSDAVVTNPTPEHFSVCSEHSCAAVRIVGLNPAQWRSVRALFQPASSTPGQERERIRSAIALIETYAGVLAGTSQDLGGDLAGLGLPGQMDCIDEATNTSLYLKLLQNSGLLKFHTVQDRATRGFLINGWPHNTAVIHDTLGKRDYAVDSWYLDNGEPPFIVPLDEWRSGWKPASDR